jgi:hypothetical protein
LDNRRVFKPSIIKRVAAWGLILVFGGLFVALLVFSRLNVAKTSASDLWASAGLGLFLLLLALVGIAGLRTYFALDGDTIEFVRPFATRRFHVSELGGFGVLQVSVNGAPLLFFLLYGFGPKQVPRIPVNLGQRTEVEQWFLTRLPIVVDDGSRVPSQAAVLRRPRARPRPHFQAVALRSARLSRRLGMPPMAAFVRRHSLLRVDTRRI